MIPACEQEFCSAGDRAEFSDDQAVAVDRIMVQNIVFFKIPRIADEIVIDRVVADLDVGVSDRIFQINRLLIVRTG